MHSPACVKLQPKHNFYAYSQQRNPKRMTTFEETQDIEHEDTLKEMRASRSWGFDVIVVFLSRRIRVDNLHMRTGTWLCSEIMASKRASLRLRCLWKQGVGHLIVQCSAVNGR